MSRESEKLCPRRRRMGRALAKPIMHRAEETVMGFAFALPILRELQMRKRRYHPRTPSLRGALATKQSRVPPRKDSGLLRFARNDECGVAFGTRPKHHPRHEKAPVGGGRFL